MDFRAAMTGSQKKGSQTDPDSISSSETRQPQPTRQPLPTTTQLTGVSQISSMENSSQNLSLQLTVHKLNGNNYLEWAQSVRLAIDGRGKLGHLTGEIPRPAADDPGLKVWRSENSLIIAWLINSMEPAIGKPHLFLPTARDVWEAVRDMYSDVENSSQIFDLKTRLWKAKQGDRDVTSYYNELVTLWQELDLCYEDEWDCQKDSVRYKKREENDRVYVFLAGLNQELDEVRGRILGRKPLSSIREVFSEVRREESRRRVMLKTQEPKNSPDIENSALVSRGLDSEENRKKKPWCDHCKKHWHTRETCWKLHGRPPNQKKKTGGEGRALQTMGEDSQGQPVNSETHSFTKEQLSHLYKLFQSPQFSNPSCSLAKKGNYFIAALSCENLNPYCSWIIDSGATDHMTGSSKLFSSYNPCAGNKKIKIADGSLSVIAGIGSIIISPSLTLHKVLHVPSLSCNLLSISKLTNDLKCQVNFFPSYCEFQELTSGKTIGSARKSGGLYFFEEGSKLKRPVQSTCYGSVSFVDNKEIMLWHYRLGHPNFHYLKHLLPDLFKNKNPSSLQCEFCELAKHHRSSFSLQPYKPTKPFVLIHTDVWGPSRIVTPSGKKWFVTFIDDHTRLSWVYLLKEKTEVKSIFQNFYTMVLTQFQTKIQILRSDNGKEYFNKTLGPFFLEKGIVHQSSCNDTPQQNGVAERKNKHLLEVARALLFSKNVSKYLWGEAILTATYLINRMPSRILKFKTPLSAFQNIYPSTRLISDIPLKIFGCTAFIHNHDHSRGKLDPRATRCVFVGYAPTQKGYKCFDPISKKMFITIDVTFFEDKPFFGTHLQGGREREDSNDDDVFQIQEEPFFQNPVFQTSRQDTIVENQELDPDESNPTDLVKKSDPSGLDSEQVRQISVENIGETVPLSLVPSEKNNPTEERDRDITCTKLQTYFRRNYRSKDKVPASLQSHESEPGKEPEVSELLGKNSSTEFFDDLDIPIACRKGVRSCTKHPMSHFVSYDKLSPTFFAFTSQLSSVEIPRNVQEALQVPEWRNAVNEEMAALEKNRTWEVVDLPKGKKTVGCKWVFTVKYNSDGTIERYKARLVAKGFTQTYGIDYLETFAPVAKLNTVRVLLTIAVNLDWPLHQLDVKNAFLNGDLEEEVYMDSPSGFDERFNTKVCKLKKSLYGLKQSPRAWFDKFTRSMKSQRYVQAQSDHTMFIKGSKEGKIAVLIVYVDDIILTGDDVVEMERLKKSLALEFEIKDLGALRYFLGMEVARSKKGLVVSQRKYVLDLLKETGMSGCRPADTPMDPNQKLGDVTDRAPVDKARYQKLVGKLIYLSHTRPDIAFAVSVVSQFMHSPYEEHLEAVYRILRYLKSTPGKGLFFKKGEQRTIEAYTDADWAGSVTDRRSTSGYCTFVWGNLVTWRSKKQNVVARSSAEAEYRAMAHGVCEMLWLKRILNELGQPTEGPMKLYCDNKAAISIAHNPVQHDRTKHVEIDRHFIKEKLEGGVICLPFVPTTQQIADIFTKGLFRPNFELLTGKLGMMNIYAPT